MGHSLKAKHVHVHIVAIFNLVKKKCLVSNCLLRTLWLANDWKKQEDKIGNFSGLST